MKERSPIARSALKPSTPEQVRAWQTKSRKPLVRARLAQGRTKNAVRQLAPTPSEAFARGVKARARGRCEACAIHTLPGCDGRYAHAHHLVPRGRGRGWSGLHELANGLGVSAEHHSWVHRNPAEAKSLGLLLSRPVGA